MKLNLTIKLPWAKFRHFTTIDWHNYNKCHFNSFQITFVVAFTAYK